MTLFQSNGHSFDIRARMFRESLFNWDRMDVLQIDYSEFLMAIRRGAKQSGDAFNDG